MQVKERYRMGAFSSSAVTGESWSLAPGSRRVTDSPMLVSHYTGGGASHRCACGVRPWRPAEDSAHFFRQRSGNGFKGKLHRDPAAPRFCVFLMANRAYA